MARKKKKPPSGPSNAYLISFGDTMTALLAFFIVMNSLAKEQTGADLYSGTGSFVSALASSGLPGAFKAKASENSFQKTDPGPLYIISEDKKNDEVADAGKGDQDESNTERIIDHEKDSLQRLLIELDNFADVRELRQVKGKVVVDLFEDISSDPPQVSDSTKQLFSQMSSKLRSGNYRMEIIVWATMPSVGSWKLAVKRANRLSDTLARRDSLSVDQRSRLKASGKPWFFRDARRPKFSFVLSKLD